MFAYLFNLQWMTLAVQAPKTPNESSSCLIYTRQRNSFLYYAYLLRIFVIRVVVHLGAGNNGDHLIGMH